MKIYLHEWREKNENIVPNEHKVMKEYALFDYSTIKIKGKDTFFNEESYFIMVQIVINLEYLLVI